MENKKLNVFISQPIGKRSYYDMMDVNDRVMGKVKRYFETDNTFLIPSRWEPGTFLTNSKNDDLLWLSMSLNAMAYADVVVMATGWEESRICRIEYTCARFYDIVVIFEDTNYITSENQFEVEHDSTASD